MPVWGQGVSHCPLRMLVCEQIKGEIVMHKRQGKVFYGWWMVLGGVFTFGSVVGLLSNCWSLFTVPICEDLGLTRQQMGMIQTGVSVLNMLLVVNIGRIYRRVSPLLLMRAAAVIVPLSFFMRSQVNGLVGLLICASCMGLTMGLLTSSPLSLIFTNWFEKKRGTAIGIAYAGSGMLGMLMTPWINSWIALWGWRVAVQILAVLVFIIVVPCCFFLYKLHPEDKGLRAYGSSLAVASEEKPPLVGPLYREVRGSAVFILILCCGFVIDFGSPGLIHITAPHLTDLGYSQSMVSLMVSLVMGFLALGKFFLGVLYDKIGARRATSAAAICVLVGSFGMIFAQLPPMLVLLLIGASLGASYGSVGVPNVTRALFGNRDFAAINGKLMAASSLGGAISSTFFGWVNDTFGSYRPAYLLCVLMLCVVLVVLQLLFRKAAKQQKAVS